MGAPATQAFTETSAEAAASRSTWSAARPSAETTAVLLQHPFSPAHAPAQASASPTACASAHDLDDADAEAQP
jgi:hypothetical protein